MDVDGWFDFSDRVVVVSGGAGGIGREISQAFAHQGARVIVADFDGDAAETIAAEITASGVGEGVPAQIDVRDADAAEALIAGTCRDYGKVDVLVNTAAVYVRVAALDLAEADYDRTMDVNVKGTWLLSQAAGRRMTEREFGRIINYTSNAGNRGSALQLAYNASKAAIISMTKSLAVEWGRTGVTVNAVAPGPTDTALMAPAFVDPQLVASFSQRIPQGSLTPPNASVGPVLFLASPLAQSITGHTLYADGGMSAT